MEYVLLNDSTLCMINLFCVSCVREHEENNLPELTQLFFYVFSQI